MNSFLRAKVLIAALTASIPSGRAEQLESVPALTFPLGSIKITKSDLLIPEPPPPSILVRFGATYCKLPSLAQSGVKETASDVAAEIIHAGKRTSMAFGLALEIYAAHQCDLLKPAAQELSEEWKSGKAPGYFDRAAPGQ